jgi:sulfotransferase family protein
MTPDPIEGPVFVIGTGRSGLTPLMDLIAYHDAFAWPSQYNERRPEAPKLSLLSRVVDVPGFNSRLKFWRIVPKHDEAYTLWNNVFPGFAKPFRDLVEDDVTPYVRQRFRSVVDEIAQYQGKNRFIAEYSGWSRIEFLKSIFPDARFIHIVRDGRAVAHSYLNVPWWRGWEGVYAWQWGTPNGEIKEMLSRYHHSFLALAAVNWLLLVNNICEKARSLREGDFLSVRYEDLVEDPRREAFRCIEFCGLHPNPRFEKHVSTVRIVDANTNALRIPPWRASLSERQVDMLNDLLRDALARFGYSE